MSKIEKLINNTTCCTVEPIKFEKHNNACDSCIVEPYYTGPSPYKYQPSISTPHHEVNPNIYPTESTDIDKIKEHVNHPSHYQSKTGMEVIDIIDAFDLNFNLGNVIKYVLRCEKKESDIRDLEKAKWYLEREISNRK